MLKNFIHLQKLAKRIIILIFRYKLYLFTIRTFALEI